MDKEPMALCFIGALAAVLAVGVGCSADNAGLHEEAEGATQKPAETARVEQHGIGAGHDVRSKGTRGNAPLSNGEMLEALSPRLSRSTAGLSFENRKDGLRSVKLQGRFTHITMARRMPDGTIGFACVDSEKALKRWLENHPRGDGR